MGHANISITLDRYGHLMPGSEGEAAGLLNTYLAAQRERAEDAARSAGDSLIGGFTGDSWGTSPRNRMSKPLSHYPAQSWTIWDT
jgi:hypothetical protein